MRACVNGAICLDGFKSFAAYFSVCLVFFFFLLQGYGFVVYQMFLKSLINDGKKTGPDIKIYLVVTKLIIVIFISYENRIE